MSLFNINYFNAGSVFSGVYSDPTTSTYSNLKIFGAGTFDDVHVLNRVLSQSEIDSLDLLEEPEWDVFTLMLAKFNNNLQAGNIVSLDDPIDNWIVRRKRSDESKFTVLAELEADATEYTDRLAESRKTYTYQAIPLAGDALGEPIEDDNVVTDFQRVVLLDPDTEEGYSFCLEVGRSQITTNERVTQQQTKGKYDTFLTENRKFASGSISTIPESNSVTAQEIEQDIAFINQLEDFITNGNEKILKFESGFTYRVYTNNFVKAQRQGETSNGQILNSISFDWNEIGELI